MPKAIYNGVVIAASENTEIVEGNHYFPPESVKREFFRPNARQTRCPWKGQASYYDIVVADDVFSAGAWYYPSPSTAAQNIKDHVAFYGQVRIEP